MTPSKPAKTRSATTPTARRVMPSGLYALPPADPVRLQPNYPGLWYCQSLPNRYLLAGLVPGIRVLI